MHDALDGVEGTMRTVAQATERNARANRKRKRRQDGDKTRRQQTTPPHHATAQASSSADAKPKRPGHHVSRKCQDVGGQFHPSMQAARQWNLVELQAHWRSRCNLAHPSTNVPSMLQYLHLRECSQQHSKQVPRYNFLARRLFECGDSRYKRHYSLGKPSCCGTHPPLFCHHAVHASVTHTH